MQSTINKIELEKILLAQWSNFLNPRDLMKLAAQEAAYENINGPISNLTLSRCELVTFGLFVWIEYQCNEQRLTTQALLMLRNDDQSNQLIKITDVLTYLT